MTRSPAGTANLDMGTAEGTPTELLYQTNFRPYQAEAVEMVRRYSREFADGNRDDDAPSAALGS